jgi:hypothetical protein
MLDNSESYRDSQNLHRIMSRHDFATAIAVAGLSCRRAHNRAHE